MRWPPRRTPGARAAGGPAPAATEPAAPPGPISRPGVMRRLTALYARPRYLEVGVCDGHTFDEVPAARKVAVDPEFRFDHEAPERRVRGVEYHPVTSDEYFAGLDADAEFDVIYLDGLHTFEQTLRDLMNAVQHLQPRGVIVLDDTRPPTEMAAIRDRQEYFAERDRTGSRDKRWMGDVFKLVWFIDSFCPGLTFRTISNNHGQTVVWRQPRRAVTERRMHEIAELDFAAFLAEEEVLQLRYFRDIRAELCADLDLRPPS